MKNFTRPMWKAESPGSSHLICGFIAAQRSGLFFSRGGGGDRGRFSVSSKLGYLWILAGALLIV